MVRSNRVARKRPAESNAMYLGLEDIRLVFGFWFMVCCATTQLAMQLQLECIQVVCSNREARKPTEANGTPVTDLGSFLFLFFLVFGSTQLARQVQQERTQMEVQ